MIMDLGMNIVVALVMFKFSQPSVQQSRLLG